MSQTLPNLPLALLLGLVAGSRTMTPLAAVSLAARGGQLPAGPAAALLGHPTAPRVLAIAAAGELLTDKLPGLGRRTVPVQLLGRLVSGAVCGAAVGGRRFGPAMAAGLLGAALGTFATAALRSGLARGLGSDVPAALLEDALIVGTVAVLHRRLANPA